MKTFPRFLSILISALLLAALISGYQGSLLIELTLPGGGARVQLDNASNPGHLHAERDTSSLMAKSFD